eukprot:4337780-Heterocapsa_arctica.AAC.1
MKKPKLDNVYGCRYPLVFGIMHVTAMEIGGGARSCASSAARAAPACCAVRSPACPPSKSTRSARCLRT